MQVIRTLIIAFLLCVTSIYFINEYQLLTLDSIKKIAHFIQPKEIEIKDKEVPKKKMLSSTFDGDLFHWIGTSEDELVKQVGEPERKDLSAYKYTWWVYPNLDEQYVQFGIMDGEVATIFATGNNLSASALNSGNTYDEIDQALNFEEEVTYKEGISTYQFQLSKDDLNMRPLVKVSDNIFVQFYFDTFTKQLSSLRILTGDVLLKHRPYHLEYRGQLADQPALSEEDWQDVEKGMEQQIFDMTNQIRDQHGLSQLEWEDAVSDVAFLHSRDMEENDYFSHETPDGDGLKERLSSQDVYYLAAGENIAAMYPDAAAAMEGWMNSESHREALLSDHYTHLGVGVYRLYYTQNFLQQP